MPGLGLHMVPALKSIKKRTGAENQEQHTLDEWHAYLTTQFDSLFVRLCKIS